MKLTVLNKLCKKILILHLIFVLSCRNNAGEDDELDNLDETPKVDPYKNNNVTNITNINNINNTKNVSNIENLTSEDVSNLSKKDAKKILDKINNNPNLKNKIKPQILNELQQKVSNENDTNDNIIGIANINTLEDLTSDAISNLSKKDAKKILDKVNNNLNLKNNIKPDILNELQQKASNENNTNDNIIGIANINTLEDLTSDAISNLSKKNAKKILDKVNSNPNLKNNIEPVILNELQQKANENNTNNNIIGIANINTLEDLTSDAISNLSKKDAKKILDKVNSNPNLKNNIESQIITELTTKATKTFTPTKFEKLENVQLNPLGESNVTITNDLNINSIQDVNAIIIEDTKTHKSNWNNSLICKKLGFNIYRQFALLKNTLADDKKILDIFSNGTEDTLDNKSTSVSSSLINGILKNIGMYPQGLHLYSKLVDLKLTDIQYDHTDDNGNKYKPMDIAIRYAINNNNGLLKYLVNNKGLKVTQDQIDNIKIENIITNKTDSYTKMEELYNVLEEHLSDDYENHNNNGYNEIELDDNDISVIQNPGLKDILLKIKNGTLDINTLDLNGTSNNNPYFLAIEDEDNGNTFINTFNNEEEQFKKRIKYLKCMIKAGIYVPCKEHDYDTIWDIASDYYDRSSSQSEFQVDNNWYKFIKEAYLVLLQSNLITKLKGDKNNILKNFKNGIGNIKKEYKTLSEVNSFISKHKTV